MSKAPANFGEFVATLNRSRSAAETDAALAQGGVGGGGAGGAGGAAQLDLRLGSGVAAVALAGAELAVMTFGFAQPVLLQAAEAVVARLDLAPTYSGLLLRALPGALRAAQWAAGHAAILLWLLSFAEVALFLASALAARSQGASAWGVAAALGERPLRLLDALAMALNGPVVFTAKTTSSACGGPAPPLPAAAGPLSRTLLSLHTRARAAALAPPSLLQLCAQWWPSACCAWRTWWPCWWRSCSRAASARRGGTRERAAPTSRCARRTLTCARPLSGSSRRAAR